MSFIEERLMEQLSYGFSGGPTYYTRRVGLRNGITRRNVMRTRPLHVFTGSFDRRDDAAIATLINTFNATRGAAFGFRFKNPMDYQVTDCPLVVADGTSQQVQLEREFTFGTETLRVPVRKPNNDVQLYSNGVPIGSSVDTTTGVVTFVGVNGEQITWTGTFDLPVFFKNDDFMATIEQWNGTTVDLQLEEDLSA